MGVNLASFKNSRNYPRPASTRGLTQILTVVNNAALNPSNILLNDPNRNYAEVYNRHATDTMKYFYQNPGDPNPTVAQILANGFDLIHGAAFEIDVPVAVWAVSTTINPIPIDLDIGSG